MYFYELKTGTIWASKEVVLSKNGKFDGEFHRVRSRTSEPDKELYDVSFKRKQVSCVWTRAEEEEGQLFGKVNPNHKKAKNAGTNA